MYVSEMSKYYILFIFLMHAHITADELSQLAQKSTDELGYNASASPISSPFEHSATGFKASWICMTCELDKLFKPAIIVPETTRATQVGAYFSNAISLVCSSS